MKIAHAILLPLLHQGGVEVLVRTLLECAPADDELVLISRDPSKELEASGMAPRIRAHLSIPQGEVTRQWLGSMAAWLTHQQVDLCHFHLAGNYDWWAPQWHASPIPEVARTGIATVTTNHQAFTFFDQAHPSGSFLRNCAKTLVCWPGKARQLASVKWEATVSKHDLAISRRSFPGFGHKLTQVYHSRLDADADVETEPSQNTILNVATIAFRKGQHVLVDAFVRTAADFPHWRLHLVGSMAQQECVEQIRETIRKAGLEDRVDLTGPDPDPAKRFKTCGIYVQPSLMEGLGLSLQEAMFYGRPCVGAACGGIPELINDPSVGLLHRPGDASSLAEALSRLISDPALRQRLGDAARSSILNRGMTRQAMNDAYQALYHKALSS